MAVTNKNFVKMENESQKFKDREKEKEISETYFN